MNGNCLRSLPPSFRWLKQLKALSMTGVQWLSRGMMGEEDLMNKDKFTSWQKVQNWNVWSEYQAAKNEVVRTLLSISNSSIGFINYYLLLYFLWVICVSNTCVYTGGYTSTING